MREAVIVAYGRSPVCRSRKGGFSGMHPLEYAAQTLKGVLAKVPELDPAEIEDVIVGCAVQTGKTSMNMGKLLAARAELPTSVSAQTINRFCSSGLQAIATAGNAIMAGQGDVYIAGGIEDMTSTFAPYPIEDCDPWLLENNKAAYMPMGLTAENIVRHYGITRKEMDEFAVASHQKAKAARDSGKLAPSIIPVKGIDAEGNILPEAKAGVEALLRRSFRPEFLNRLDEIVFYKPLTKQDITRIIDLQIGSLNRRLADQQLSVTLTDSAKAHIADNAYDPQYGARPLRRYIRQHIETDLSRRILKDDVTPGQTMTVDVQDSMLVIL